MIPRRPVLPTGIDRLVFEARHLRDHMVYLDRTESGPALSAALVPFEGEGPPDAKSAMKLREALHAAFAEVSDQVDKHTLREVLAGNPPHARNAPTGASIVLAFIGILFVACAFHFTHWSSHGESLLAEMQSYQEFDHDNRAIELADLLDAIRAEGGLATVAPPGIGEDEGEFTPQQTHLIYYRGIRELSRHYKLESDLPKDVIEHIDAFNPVSFVWTGWRKSRCLRIGTELDTYAARFLAPYTVLDAAASGDETQAGDGPAVGSPDDETPMLLSIDGDKANGGVEVARADQPGGVADQTGPPAGRAAGGIALLADADFGRLLDRESGACPGQSRQRVRKIEATFTAPAAAGAVAAQPIPVGQIAPFGGRQRSEAYEAVRQRITSVAADAGRANGYISSPAALRTWRESLVSTLEIVHRWFLPAIYGGLGSVVYCLWRILSPDLSPLGARYTILRTSFAALAAITLSMLLIPSQTLTLGAEPSRPFIYLLCFISGYSIEAFITALSRLNSVLTSRLAPKEDVAPKTGA